MGSSPFFHTSRTASIGYGADPAEDCGPRTRKDGQSMVPGEHVLWEGTEWPCWPCCCLSPMCCSSIRWTITNVRLDKKHGCCWTNDDTIDIRRITDLKYRAAPAYTRTCCCRGTLVIFSGDATDPETTINTWGTRSVYLALKDAWAAAKANVAVSTDGGGQEGV